MRTYLDNDCISVVLSYMTMRDYYVMLHPGVDPSWLDDIGKALYFTSCDAPYSHSFAIKGKIYKPMYRDLGWGWSNCRVSDSKWSTELWNLLTR